MELTDEIQTLHASTQVESAMTNHLVDYVNACSLLHDSHAKPMDVPKLCQDMYTSQKEGEDLQSQYLE